MALPLKIEEVRITRVKGLDREIPEIWIRSKKINEPSRIPVRQRTNENGVHDTEDGGASSDTKGECKDYNDVEAGVLRSVRRP